MLGRERLAAPGHHASAVEVHQGRHRSRRQFGREVEVQFDVEGVDVGVGDALHDCCFEFGGVLRFQIIIINGQ